MWPHGFMNGRPVSSSPPFVYRGRCPGIPLNGEERCGWISEHPQQKPVLFSLVLSILIQSKNICGAHLFRHSPGHWINRDENAIKLNFMGK